MIENCALNIEVVFKTGFTVASFSSLNLPLSSLSYPINRFFLFWCDTYCHCLLLLLVTATS